jgi:FkbM family methyltransferase
MDLFCEGDRAAFAAGTLRFPDRHSLWVVVQEILVNEEYFFATDTDSPRILDCGAHFGMASFYFKTLYPKARITAFEPVPALHALARENMAANGFADVEVLPCALTPEGGPVTFHVSPEDSMAGSITTRRESLGDTTERIEVESRRLSEFLTEPVDYLKVDIEGAELEVFEEAEPQLGNVAHIFCEYHHGAGLDPSRLARLLDLFERTGFDVHVSKSDSSEKHARRRPMEHVGAPYSATLWAKRR